MKLRPRALPALTLLAAFALAACGGGTATQPTAGGAGQPAATGSTAATPGIPGIATTTPGGGALDVCALLTVADIESVTGEKVKSSTPGPQMGTFADGCAWDFENLEIPAPAIELGVVAEGGRKIWDEDYKPFLEENGQEPVAGVGDDAATFLAGTVIAVSGDTFFSVKYVGLSSDDMAVAAELGRMVVANLGN